MPFDYTVRPHSFEGSDVDALSDAEILELFENDIPLSPSEHPHTNGIVRITDGTIGKISQDREGSVEPSEAMILNVVFDHTDNPVPASDVSFRGNTIPSSSWILCRVASFPLYGFHYRALIKPNSH